MFSAFFKRVDQLFPGREKLREMSEKIGEYFFIHKTSSLNLEVL